MKITFFKIKLFSYLGAIVFACAAHGQSPPDQPNTAAPAIDACRHRSERRGDRLARGSVTSATIAPSATSHRPSLLQPVPTRKKTSTRQSRRKSGRHFKVDFDGGHSGNHSGDDVPWIAIPIVLSSS